MTTKDEMQNKEKIQIQAEVEKGHVKYTLLISEFTKDSRNDIDRQCNYNSNNLFLRDTLVTVTQITNHDMGHLLLPLDKTGTSLTAFFLTSTPIYYAMNGNIQQNNSGFVKQNGS